MINEVYFNESPYRNVNVITYLSISYPTTISSSFIVQVSLTYSSIDIEPFMMLWSLLCNSMIQDLLLNK